MAGQQRPRTGGTDEHIFNGFLGEALAATNARWRADPDNTVLIERNKDGRRIDIEIDDPRFRRVAIETAYGGDKDADAIKRLNNDPDIDTAIAVAIPVEIKGMGHTEARRAVLKGEPPLEYAVVQKDYRFPRNGYIKGTVKDLAAIIPVAAVTRERLATLADKVAKRIDRARQVLEHGIPPHLAKKLIADVYQRSTLTGFRTILVLWLDAMLVQAHLHSADHEDVEDIDALPLADEIANGEVLPSDVEAAWRGVLGTNWRSIFEPAVDALRRTRRKSTTAAAAALVELRNAVELIDAAKLGDHINIAAELFPKLSEDRKNTAAFYTTAATAEILAAILIRDGDHDWSDPTIFENLRVADLACGTGSLLRAAYHRISRLHEERDGDATDMHRRAMERGITGVDVSPIAAHLATSSLALMGGGERYGDTQIGWADVGEPTAHGATTGSLEYMVRSHVDDMFTTPGGSTGGTTRKSRTIVVEDGSLDYAIMNPPYTLGRVAFDIAGLTAKQRELCLDRWKWLQNRRTKLRGRRVIKRTAGMAACFVCIAEAKLKPGGRMGFVLPATCAANESWDDTRRMIQLLFKDVVVVTQAGAGGGAEAMSADTNMGEMLLIATKRRKPVADDAATPVTAATLHNMPTRQGEAGEYARAVTMATARTGGYQGGYPVKAGGDDLGIVVKCSYPQGGPWSALGTSDMDLLAMATGIASGKGLDDAAGGMDFNVPFAPLASVFDPSPMQVSIGHVVGSVPRGAYELHEIPPGSAGRGHYCSLWKADSTEQTRLVVSPTHRGIERDSAQANRIRGDRGFVHYARGIRWTSQRLLTATTERPVFGGRAWLTLKHGDEGVRKAFALWANSTLGMVVHWSQAGRQQKGRALAHAHAIKAVPCPVFDKLPQSRLKAAAAAFDGIKGEAMLPACQAHADPVRKRIDSAVIAVMGLPVKRAEAAVAVLRDLWCAEPSVHGDNRKALAKLAGRMPAKKAA